MVQWAADVSVDATMPTGIKRTAIVAVVENPAPSAPAAQHRAICRTIRENLEEGRPVVVKGWAPDGHWGWDLDTAEGIAGSGGSNVNWHGKWRPMACFLSSTDFPFRRTTSQARSNRTWRGLPLRRYCTRHVDGGRGSREQHQRVGPAALRRSYTIVCAVSTLWHFPPRLANPLTGRSVMT